MSFSLTSQHKPNKTVKGKISTSTRLSPHQSNNSSMDPYAEIIHLQRTKGNQGLQTLLHSNNVTGFDLANIAIQPKLKVSQPGDEYEQEADRLAEQVMRMLGNHSVMQMTTVTKGEEGIDRKCSACEMEKKEDKKLSISRKPPATIESYEIDDEVTSDIDRVRSSSGAPLDADSRQSMEMAFGYDFTNVRIHTGDVAARSAASINALAYTIGNDIVFSEAQYQPNTSDGRRVLAHELAHVVQQGASPISIKNNNRISQSHAGGRVHSQEPAITEKMGTFQPSNILSKNASARSSLLRQKETIQRIGPVGGIVLTTGEWISVGGAGYGIAKDAVAETAGDVSYTFDEMDGVLLPTGGSEVAAYRSSHPDARIREYTHNLAVWYGFSGWRKMGIKFGISFLYDGYAIGSISMSLIDVYDSPGWGGKVDVNITSLALASAGTAAVRLTINMPTNNAFWNPEEYGSLIFKLDGTGLLANTSVNGAAFYAFG